MTFEEDFPSLVKMTPGDPKGMYNYRIIQMNCLDKQKVREAITKLKTWNDRDKTHADNINAEDLLKELGLDK